MTTIPLMGLEAILADDDCERVEVRNGEGGRTTTYTRLEEGIWLLQDRESDPVHTPELLDRLRDGFGRDFDRLECRLADEQVGYVLERGVARMRREPRPMGAGDLEEGWKALTDALGIPRSKRGAKLRQAEQFGRIVENGLAGRREREVRVLDLACGRSYLGFVLNHLLTTRGRRVTLHGVDNNPVFVDKCREIAATLGWSNCTFETADLAEYVAPAGAYDVLVSLHGCDTLSDEAIRIGVTAEVPLLYVAPCCQHELRFSWKDHPLQWMEHYPILEERLADIVTDGFRGLVRSEEHTSELQSH